MSSSMIAAIAIVFVVLAFCVINSCIVARSQTRKLSRNRHHLEVCFQSITTDLHRLKEVIRGSDNPEAELPERFRHLDAQRFILDKMVCMLQGMIPDSRINLCEVALVEQEIQKLWSIYYATK